MVLITDPDDADRYQCLFNVVTARLWIRSLGAARTGSLVADGATTTGTGTLTSASSDFVTDGVVAGDIVPVVSSGEARHYTVVSRDSANQLTVTPNFGASETGVSFRVFQAGQNVGPAGGTLADGISGQALYTFAKEERRTNAAGFPELLNFDFPLETLGRESYEIGGGPQDHSDWDFGDDTSRKFIRTAGYDHKDLAGTVLTTYPCFITQGQLDADTEVYYQNTLGGTPVKFSKAGPVDEVAKVYDSGGADNRTFFRAHARKKRRSYARADIAASVLPLEPIAYRLALSHGPDTAITLDDGQLAGDGTNDVFQAVETHSTGSNGATVDNGDGTFDLTSATVSPAWDDGVLRVGDTVELTSGGYQGHYEISALVDADTVTLSHEPGKTYPGDETSLTFTVRTGVRDIGGSNATLADVDGATGTLTASGKAFTTDGGLGLRDVQAGDVVVVTAGAAAVLGAYKVITADSATQLTLNTSDQAFSGETSQTYIVLRPGMHLQYFQTDATQVSGVDITFNDDGGDGRPRIVRASGSFVTDGYVKGMALDVSGSASNDTTGYGYTVDEVVSATELALIPTDVLADEGPSSGITVDGRTGIIRTLKTGDHSFGWRLLSNGGTLQDCHQWIARAERRATDIDEGSGTSRGDITDLLMEFSTPTGTTKNMYIDDLSAGDANNVTFEDVASIGRNFAFVAGIIIAVSQTLQDDPNAILRIIHASVPAGDYGSVDAVTMTDVNALPMQVTSPIPATVSFSFGYDTNVDGGRTPGTDADFVLVASGTTKAQAKKVTGTITRVSSKNFSVDAALDRVFKNP